MKKFTLSLLAAMLAFAGAARAEENTFFRDLAITQTEAAAAAELRINNLINWKVGEFQEYSISPLPGTMKKNVASEEGNAIWIVNDINMMGQAQKSEMLLDRATGKVLKYKENGQEKQMPEQKIEIIDQEATTITVPAGTFEVIHITAKSDQAKKIEVWANPSKISMDGGAQMYIESGFLPMTLKLTKFGGNN